MLEHLRILIGKMRLEVPLNLLIQEGCSGEMHRDECACVSRQDCRIPFGNEPESARYSSLLRSGCLRWMAQKVLPNAGRELLHSGTHIPVERLHNVGHTFSGDGLIM